MRLIALTGCLVLVPACVTRPLDDTGGGGGVPPSGIYQLAETRTSDCVPPPANGADSVTAEVTSDGHSITNIWIGDPYFPTQPYPADGQSFGGNIVDNGSATSDVTNCNVSQHRVITIEAQSTDAISARAVDTFANVENEAQPCYAYGSLPAQDCSVSAELRYTLIQPCASECIQLVNPPAGQPGPATFSCGC